MLSEIYNKRILALAANLPRAGRLHAPHGSATAHSKLCGSRVTVDVIMADGVVADFAQDVKACALGQASASILAQDVIGSTLAELTELRDMARALLKSGGQPPAGKWADLEVLLPVRDYKARHASTLLIFEAVVDAVMQATASAQPEPASVSAA